MRSSLLITLASAITLSQALPEAYADVLSPRAAPQSCKPAKTPPAGSICGVKGKLSAPAATTDIQSVAQENAVTSESQCLYTCLAQPHGCTSYSFNSATLKCTYYTKSVKSMKFKSSTTSKVTFQDFACYTCTGQQAVIQNANFESGTTSPWFQDAQHGETYTISAPGRNSKYAANLTTLPNTGSGIQQFVYQVPGSFYVLSVDYMFINSVDGFIAGFTSQDEGNAAEQFFVESTTVTPGVWHTATGSGATANGDGLLEILCRSFDTGAPVTCLVDNIKYTLQ